jgi:hypothetical protein
MMDAGPDHRLFIPHTGRFWTAINYPDETTSRKAWERADRELVNISCWRTKGPPENPIHWVVWAIGETLEVVDRAEKMLLKMGGKLWHHDRDDEFVFALRQRRQNKAIESVGSGDVRHRQRTPMGMVLNPDGTMTPYRKPQG